MKARKLILRGLIALLLIAIVAAGVLYLCVSAMPGGYQPAVLNDQERTEAARQFVLKIQDFGNLAQRNEPYDWTITQDEINDALASVDEIAASTAEEGHAVEVRRMMEKAGFSGPAISLDDGVLTVMVTSHELNRVVSADLSFSFTPEKLLKVHLEGARVGVLPMPDSTVRKLLEKLQAGNRRVAGSQKNTGNILLGGMSYDDLADVTSLIVGAIDKEPVSTERTWPVNNKTVRIENITIAPGKMTLHVVPVGRRRP